MQISTPRTPFLQVQTTARFPFSMSVYAMITAMELRNTGRGFSVLASEAPEGRVLYPGSRLTGHLCRLQVWVKHMPRPLPGARAPWARPPAPSLGVINSHAHLSHSAQALLI